MKNLFRVLVLMIYAFGDANSLIAQWVKTNGPYGGEIHALIAIDTNLFAGTYGGGVFLSTNYGTSWRAVNSGLADTVVHALVTSPDGKGGINLFAGTRRGVFLSTNNGISWDTVNNGLTDTIVSSLATNPNGTSGTNLFAGTREGGVFLSTNNGTSWTAVNIGLENLGVVALAAIDTNLFAGTMMSRVFLSINNGTSWTEVNRVPGYGSLSALAANSNGAGGTYLFAGCGMTYDGPPGGIFFSPNIGASWIVLDNTVTDIQTFALCSSNGTGGTNLFAVGMAGVFLITQNDTNWTVVHIGLGSWLTDAISALATDKMYLFAGTTDGVVWRRSLSEMVTEVAEKFIQIPTRCFLGQNYPNPFNPLTAISFSIPLRSFLSLKIFDLGGREVATIVSEELSAGNHTRQWNAVGMPSGVYFYRIQAGSFTETKKLVLLK